ncbi:MAG: M28 family peptidase [Flavobacteriales bacterium]|nr:M28 family peptidase [Flavobacteriales bacterium]MCB9203858.1 M28 family peptidase [Flavobacteriales bacterium]
MKRSFALLLVCLPILLHAQDPQIEAMLAEVSIDSMLYHCSAISGEFPVTVNGNTVTISSRNKNNPGNALAAQYIKERFEEHGLTTTIESFGAVGENVLATQPGLLFPNQKVVICGHYDSMPTGNDSPAADDDGSGTAAVMEAARVMSQYNYAYTVVYAAWDEEEYGLVGSNNYATAAENAGDTIVAVINIDAIAYDGDGDSLARVHVRDIANSLNLGTVAASMIGTYGIGLQIEVNNPGATYSDHASFWNHDFSAILIIEDFDNDGNPHYHTPTDEVQYFDNGYYHEIAKWAFATAATMAVPISGSVGVEENAEAEWRIYPNPTNGLLNISLDGNTATCNLEIVDMKGAAVLQTTVIGSRHSVDVSALPKGMYTLRMTSADGAVDISRPLIKN